jgi:hypothetical protein
LHGEKFAVCKIGRRSLVSLTSDKKKNEKEKEKQKG